VQRHEMINFGDSGIKGQGHTRLPGGGTILDPLGSTWPSWVNQVF